MTVQLWNLTHTIIHPDLFHAFFSPNETSVRLKLKSLFMIYLESKWCLIFVSLKISLK